MCSSGYPFSLALQAALHLPDLPTCRNRKWSQEQNGCCMSGSASMHSGIPQALPNNCSLPFISSLLQVSMGDHGQWIRGNFSFNGKYPQFSSLKGWWQPRGLTFLQCPPSRAVGAAGRTDRGQTDGQTWGRPVPAGGAGALQKDLPPTSWGSAGPPMGSAAVTVWAVTSVVKDQSAGTRDTGTENGRKTSCDVLKHLRNEKV